MSATVVAPRAQPFFRREKSGTRILLSSLRVPGELGSYDLRTASKDTSGFHAHDVDRFRFFIVLANHFHRVRISGVWQRQILVIQVVSGLGVGGI